MRVVIIGGSGRIGSYLVPRLIKAEYEVINVSRGLRTPIKPSNAWKEVRQVVMDRNTEEENGLFGKKIAALNPDIVVDIINDRVESTYQIVEALHQYQSLYFQCIYLGARTCDDGSGDGRPSETSTGKLWSKQSQK